MDRNTRFLVVDDFSTMRRIIRGLLGELAVSSANLYEADSGQQALKVLHAKPIDFVITDWNMPGMAGIELLRAIRTDLATQSIPVLMVTAENSRDQIVAAAEAGVNGYILKPFTAAILGQKINRIFERLAAAR